MIQTFPVNIDRKGNNFETVNLDSCNEFLIYDLKLTAYVLAELASTLTPFEEQAISIGGLVAAPSSK